MGRDASETAVLLEVRKRRAIKTAGQRVKAAAKAAKAAALAARKSKKINPVQEKPAATQNSEMVFRSERLNERGGDSAGRARLATQASALLGIRRRKKRT